MPVVLPIAVVFSMGKPSHTHTGDWLKAHGMSSNRIVYVLSPGDNAREYQRSTGCSVVVSDSFNLGSKRRWAVERFTSSKSPWLFFFEDNITRVTCVDSENYSKEYIGHTTRAMFHATEISPQEVIERMHEDALKAESVGANYGGFSSNDNHFFRKRKYRTVGFVWSKMAYVSRNGPQWPTYINEKDDYAHTAECLFHSGRVLINNFLYPWPAKYEGFGGSPKLQDRFPLRIESVNKLQERFPGLFRVVDRPGRQLGTEIQLRFCRENQVDQWRSKLSS